MTIQLDKLELFIVPETLSDGSQVHNVELGDISIPANSQKDAEDLACELMEVIRAHTNLSPGAGGGIYKVPAKRAS